MREILFRGKTLEENPRWVKGYYTFDHKPWIDVKDGNNFCIFDSREIDPSTLGEFTGLYDRNGVRVFEGDILRISKETDPLGNYYYPKVPYPCNVIVKWDFCAWNWETITKDKRYISFPYAWGHYSCEVIGNVYDNPELLEEAQNDDRPSI